MAKTRGMQWLEEQTGEQLGDFPQAEGRDVHLSVRLESAVASRLSERARQRSTSVSALVREALERFVRDENARSELDTTALAGRVAADADELRRRLAG
jgi:predicted transcriptional regulator